MRTQTWVKIGLGAVAIAVLPWLFLKTVRDSIAEPYRVDEAALTGWTLALADPARPGFSALGLRPPPQLVPALFDQLFNRTMESMTSPGEPLLPIVLQSEFQSVLGAVFSPDQLLEVARDARLEQTRLEPVCMGVKREPSAGRSRQLYFVLFDAPEVAAFRQALGRAAAERGGPGAFGATAFDLILPVAGSDPGFATWWPMTVDRRVDCQATLAP